jgi:hypothetical protein
MNWSILAQQEKAAVPELIEATQFTVGTCMPKLGIEHWPGKFRNGERYLVWLQWSRKYSVPLSRIITLIVTEYRRRLKQTGNNLGIALNTLTSPVTESWLRSVIGEYTLTNSRFRPKLPIRYNSIDDYANRMATLRLQNKKRIQERVYRGSTGWHAPTPDAVRTMEV